MLPYGSVLVQYRLESNGRECRSKEDADAGMSKSVTIGCPSGYWGDAPLAMPQMLRAPRIDYLVFDYLAEITMSILARARTADPALGYAIDFVSAVVAPHADEIAARGIRLIANAGGLNPEGCADAIRALLQERGLDLKVAAVTGDDLFERRTEFAASGIIDMFSGASFPDVARIASINAYLGAFPIAEALASGADIVVTGRCVDSAVTLAACIHEFGWRPDDWDRLAGGSLAGHILECSVQATGGNFTDWRGIAGNLSSIGYPIASISEDGSFVCAKPDETGGAVTPGTVAEQMLYEIGDPQAYVLPDVVCDFSEVRIEQAGPDRVRVSGARGAAPTSTYKICATYRDGYRGGTILGFYGEAAEAAARAFAEAVFVRTNAALAGTGLAPLAATSVELLGTENHYGGARRVGPAREVALKIAAKHEDQAGIARFLREISGFGLATPPGLTGFASTRPKPSPVVRLFSFLLPKAQVPAAVEIDGRQIPVSLQEGDAVAPAPARPPEPLSPEADGEMVPVPLMALAYGRSGDKGDDVNVGLIARDPAYLPYIWRALPVEEVHAVFAHFLTGEVERFLLPGVSAINFVLHGALEGGGTASLRMDPQGKGFAQLLLAHPIPVPRAIAEMAQ